MVPFTPRGDRGGRGNLGVHSGAGINKRGGSDRGGFRGRGSGGFRGGSDRGGRGGNGGFGSGRGGRGGSFGRGRITPRGTPRGRGGRGGLRGGTTVVVEPHRFEGVFVLKGKEDAISTRNLVPGNSVYGEKRVEVKSAGGDADKTEYRVWNPFRAKLAAGMMAGLENIFIKPGSKVLYLGAASGTTVSHISDLVGPEGIVYAVEFSHRSGRDLLNVAKKRPNVVPIVDDARHPNKYRMLVGMVDTIFSDVAQPDQARIVALNAHLFLKSTGHALISIKANCVDSTAEPEAVYASEVQKLKEEKFKPLEQVTLEPYEVDHAIIVSAYRTSTAKTKKLKKELIEKAE